MPEVIIYLGPSLPLAEAETILPSCPDIWYLPPIRRGDLVQAVRERPAIIGIIDGLFFENAAVGHREVLSAIKAGIIVVGASSMGALRAAELLPFGMIGIGEVFRRYRDGQIESDDEVALICDPEDNSALSEALVNIRITLENAVIDGILQQQQADNLLSVAQQSYYPERTWNMVINRGDLPASLTDSFKTWLRENKVDQKHDDAQSALQYIRELLENHKK